MIIFVTNVLALILSCAFIYSCDSGYNETTYWKGYESGRDADSSLLALRSDFLDGYDDALYDDSYDYGYDDASELRGPAEPDNPDYMDGYKDGKNDK